MPLNFTLSLEIRTNICQVNSDVISLSLKAVWMRSTTYPQLDVSEVSSWVATTRHTRSWSDLIPNPPPDCWLHIRHTAHLTPSSEGMVSSIRNVYFPSTNPPKMGGTSVLKDETKIDYSLVFITFSSWNLSLWDYLIGTVSPVMNCSYLKMYMNHWNCPYSTLSSKNYFHFLWHLNHITPANTTLPSTRAINYFSPPSHFLSINYIYEGSVLVSHIIRNPHTNFKILHTLIQKEQYRCAGHVYLLWPCIQDFLVYKISLYHYYLPL